MIWIQPSNSLESSWISPAECVWDGPQWLKSKQCLKLGAYLELEPLFKVSLNIPDASQVDVISDLLMLKSDYISKSAVRIETAGAPYGVTSVVQLGDPIERFQSITAMKEHKQHSFEVSEYCRLLAKFY